MISCQLGFRLSLPTATAGTKISYNDTPRETTTIVAPPQHHCLHGRDSIVEADARKYDDLLRVVWLEQGKLS